MDPWHSQTKFAATPQGNKYAYVSIPPKEPEKHYLLFLHGFPESSFDWHHQIDHFTSAGYGIIAPDLLGYGLTSKPADIQEYRIKKMCNEIMFILQRENAKHVIGIAHDWGSSLLARLSNWFPESFAAYAFIAVGYTPPGRFDAKLANEMTEKKFGYPGFGYFEFLGSDPKAAELMDANPDSALSLFYCEHEGHWRRHVGPPGAAKAWLEQGQTTDPPVWLDKTDLAVKKDLLVKGGFSGPNSWYRQGVSDVNDQDFASLPDENKRISGKPVLLLCGNSGQGPMTAEAREQAIAAFADQLKTQRIDGGHWLMLENPRAVNAALENFIQGL